MQRACNPLDGSWLLRENPTCSEPGALVKSSHGIREKNRRGDGETQPVRRQTSRKRHAACALVTMHVVMCHREEKKQARHDRCAVRHRQPIFLYVARVSPTLSFWNGSIDAVHMEGTDREDVSAQFVFICCVSIAKISPSSSWALGAWAPVTR